MPSSPTALPRPSSPPATWAAVAWTGAALFGAALATFLYAYFVRYARAPDPGSLAGPISIDVALFSMFALHHSLFARPRLKTWVRSVVPPVLERSLYTWVASLMLIAVCLLWLPVPGVLYRLEGPAWWMGAGAQASGLLLTFLGSKALDVLDLAGVRPLLRDHLGQPDAHVPLETSGVFAIVRHPLYFGWALVVLGAPAMTATRAVFAVVSTAYLAIAIPWEERGLVAVFGADYHAYMAKVRWRMLPGIY